MDGLDKIIQHINERAGEESEAILEEAREKAEDIKSKGREKAEDIKREIIRKGENEADRIEKSILARARTKARQKKLETKDELIEEVFESVKNELGKLRDDEEEYRGILKDFIVEGGITLDGGELKVSILRGDKELLTGEIIDEISERISGETGEKTSLKINTNLKDSMGGAIIETSDGSVRCENTFGARLKRMRSSLRIKIAEKLFRE